MYIKKIRIVMIICILMLLIAGMTTFYAFKVEPFRLKINKIELNKKQKNSETLKIVQLSDTHIKADFTVKELRKAVNKINHEKPDLIVFTGDLYDNYGTYNDDERLIAELQRLDATIGKYAVWGNRDYGGGSESIYENILTESGFQLLKNAQQMVTLSNDKRLLLAGLDDTMLGQPIPLDTTRVRQADYAVLLSHEPDTAMNYFDDGYDLILSGHSHGGQIKIPFIPQINKKALRVTRYADNYDAGLYEVGENKKTKLYVNTGLGTTHISARLGVVPEISSFEIQL